MQFFARTSSLTIGTKASVSLHHSFKVSLRFKSSSVTPALVHHHISLSTIINSCLSFLHISATLYTSNKLISPRHCFYYVRISATAYLLRPNLQPDNLRFKRTGFFPPMFPLPGFALLSCFHHSSEQTFILQQLTLMSPPL